MKVTANPDRSRREREGCGRPHAHRADTGGGKRINPRLHHRGGMMVADGPRRVAAVPVT